RRAKRERPTPARVFRGTGLPPPAAEPGADARAGRHRDDRRADQRAVVHAEMRLVDLIDRVQAAAAEARRDARLELQRRLQEEPLERSAALVVVGRLARRGIDP